MRGFEIFAVASWKPRVLQNEHLLEIFQLSESSEIE